MDRQDEIVNVYAEHVVAPTFSAGEVLRLTFSMLGKNPLLYLALAFFAGLPDMLISFSFPAGAGKGAGSLVNTLFSVIFMGAIAYGVYKGLIGETAGLGEAVSRGLSRYWSLMGLSFLVGIVMLLLMGGAMVVLFIAGDVAGIFAIILAACGIGYISCIWAVTTPACVVERLSATESMSRSGALTKGHRGAIVGLMLLFALLAFVCGFLVGFLFPYEGFAQTVAEKLTDIPVLAVAQVGVSVLYYQLRAAKEGVSISSLARVFE